MYTKYTITTFKNQQVSFTDGYSDNEKNFTDDAFTKIVSLVEEGKTPGFNDYEGPGKVKRLWIDQNAAEEWKQFILENSIKHNVPVVDIEIFDNTENS